MHQLPNKKIINSIILNYNNWNSIMKYNINFKLFILLYIHFKTIRLSYVLNLL